MLKNEPSFASLLVKQSPAMHYGDGWIVGQNGQRWHPCLIKENVDKSRVNAYSEMPCCLRKAPTPMLSAWFTAVLKMCRLPVFTPLIKRAPGVISGSEGEIDSGCCLSTSSPLMVKTAPDSPSLWRVAEMKPLCSSHAKESSTNRLSDDKTSPIISCGTVVLPSMKSFGSRGRGDGKDS